MMTSECIVSKFYDTIMYRHKHYIITHYRSGEPFVYHSSCIPCMLYLYGALTLFIKILNFFVCSHWLIWRTFMVWQLWQLCCLKVNWIWDFFVINHEPKKPLSLTRNVCVSDSPTKSFDCTIAHYTDNDNALEYRNLVIYWSTLPIYPYQSTAGVYLLIWMTLSLTMNKWIYELGAAWQARKLKWMHAVNWTSADYLYES